MKLGIKQGKLLHMKIKTLLFSLLMVLSASLIASATSPAPDEHPGYTLRLETSIYPNPTSGVFFLNLRTDDLQSYRVRVVNLIGQTVATETVQANTRVRFDLTTSPKGVYFVQIEAGAEQIVRRVILQ